MINDGKPVVWLFLYIRYLKNRSSVKHAGLAKDSMKRRRSLPSYRAAALTQRPGLRELGLRITNYCSAKIHKLQDNWETKKEVYISTYHRRTDSTPTVLVSGTSRLQHPFGLRPASPNKASMYYIVQKLIAKHSVKQTPGAKSTLSAGLQVVCHHKCFSFRQEKIIS